jgi:hypothetical protein
MFTGTLAERNRHGARKQSQGTGTDMKTQDGRGMAIFHTPFVSIRRKAGFRDGYEFASARVPFFFVLDDYCWHGNLCIPEFRLSHGSSEVMRELRASVPQSREVPTEGFFWEVCH